MKPLTPQRYFDNRAICPIVIARLAIQDMQEDCSKKLKPELYAWFVAHADARVCSLHANNPHWRSRLERESEEDRDFVIGFVEQWARAFVLNPEEYQKRVSDGQEKT